MASGPLKIKKGTCPRPVLILATWCHTTESVGEKEKSSLNKSILVCLNFFCQSVVKGLAGYTHNLDQEFVGWSQIVSTSVGSDSIYPLISFLLLLQVNEFSGNNKWIIYQGHLIGKGTQVSSWIPFNVRMTFNFM